MAVSLGLAGEEFKLNIFGVIMFIYFRKFLRCFGWYLKEVLLKILCLILISNIKVDWNISLMRLSRLKVLSMKKLLNF